MKEITSINVNIQNKLWNQIKYHENTGVGGQISTTNLESFMIYFIAGSEFSSVSTSINATMNWVPREKMCKNN